MDEFAANEYNRDGTPLDYEGTSAEQDALKLNLEDSKLVEVIDDRIKKSREYFTDKDLYERRAKNLEYYLGQQIKKMESEKKLKNHHARYQDNIIYEAELTLKPIALSRIPDLVVHPGNDTPQSKEVADTLSDHLNTDLRKMENRFVLGRAYRHRPIYFTGVIKYRWDPAKGKNGDYVFECIHPDNIDVDETATSNDTSLMDWVAHHYPISLKEAFMKFPQKKNELTKELGLSEKDLESEKKLATKIKISEVWFKWFEESKDEMTGESKWEMINGVVWKFKTVILNKMKNPNWDWEGEKRLFKYDESRKKQDVSEDEMRQSFLSGFPLEGVQSEQVFRNHLDQPEFPFIFIGYDQLGMMPYDETSRIEQNIYLQDNVNKRGKQISEMADRTVGKDVFSTDSGLTKADIQKLDKSDPDQDILIKGKLNEVYMHIPGDQPTVALFEEQKLNRERAFAKAGAHATTRGERESDETATGRQILREADYGKQDDEVQETINYAAVKMANAAMQLMKLRYTEEHLKRSKGKDGSVAFHSLTRDMIDDGMEVEVSASGVDKLRRKEEAFERAQLKMTDPLSFFEDTEASDPKGRTERLMWFTVDPNAYMSKYVLDVDPNNPQEMGEALNGTQGQPNEQVLMDIAMLSQGGMPTPPNPLDPGYIEALTAFMSTPDFAALPPEIQASFQTYVSQLTASSGVV
jgi:hypothetical protein